MTKPLFSPSSDRSSQGPSVTKSNNPVDASQVTAPGDVTLYEAQLSWWPFGPSFLLALVLMAGGFSALYFRHWHYAYQWLSLTSIAGLYYFVKAMLEKWSIRARVTNRHVIVSKNLVSLHSATLNINRIESVEVHQSLFPRMLNYGNVIIRGLGSDDLILRGILAPELFKKAVMDVLEQSKL